MKVLIYYVIGVTDFVVVILNGLMRVRNLNFKYWLYDLMQYDGSAVQNLTRNWQTMMSWC